MSFRVKLVILKASFRVKSDVSKASSRVKIGINEGMLTENIVAQQLVSRGHKLYYFSRSDPKTYRNRIEIDFLISRPYENAAGRYRISPIEVKSGKSYTTPSLDKFKERYGQRIGGEIVFHPKQMERRGDRLFLPLYMSGLL